MYKTLITAAFAAALTIAAPAVHAQDRPDGRIVDQTIVTFHNVDYQNPAQARQAYDRLVTAAHTVCDSEGGDVMTRAEDETCRQQAVKDALADLHQPQMDRLAERDAGKPAQQLAFQDRR